MALCSPTSPRLPVTGKLTTKCLEHGGHERCQLNYLPQSVNNEASSPIVIDLHGSGSCAESLMWYSGWVQLADENGFTLLVPQGIDQSWNAGKCCGKAHENDIDDVGFLEKVTSKTECFCVQVNFRLQKIKSLFLQLFKVCKKENSSFFSF